ncbi:MAG: hypothetical protein QXD43_02700 [Candidatus Aenigmatarchaeota archaeon]
MTVLSRQSIMEYMRREQDPLQIYSLENNVKKFIDKSQINSHSVNLSIGNKVGELDFFKLEEELSYVFLLDRKEYLYYGGINPDIDRKAIEKSLRILDLSNLNSYVIEKEGIGEKDCYSYKVKTTDGYTFSTRIKIKNNKASAIILHPDVFDSNLRYTHQIDVLKTMQKSLSLINSSLSLLEKSCKRKLSKNELKELKSNIQKTDYISLALNEKINKGYEHPSASFSVVWTKEYVHMPRDLTATIQTKSKFARLGISVHPSSGKVDAGFCNQLALEFKNVGKNPVVMNISQAVAELQFEKLDKPTNLSYVERENSLYKCKITF